MDLYTSKQRWKLLLVVLALAVVGGSLFYSNQSIQKIGERERSKARQWALALRKKAELVALSSEIFTALQEKERQKMDLVVRANRTLLGASDLTVSQDVDFALDIIEATRLAIAWHLISIAALRQGPIVDQARVCWAAAPQGGLLG